MSEDERLAIFTAGVQTHFDVPPRPKSLLSAIRAIGSKTERLRAENAWNAAHRLRLVIQIWTHFLMLGMLRRDWMTQRRTRLRAGSPNSSVSAAC